MAIYKSFDDVPSDVLDSIRNAGTRSLFLCHEWFENYVRTVVPDPNRVSLFAASSNDAGHTAVLLALYDEQRRSIVAPRQLNALANYYSSRFEPLWAPRDTFPTTLIAALVSEISSADPRWDIVNISPCRPDNIAIQTMIEAFTENNWALQKYHCFKNLYLQNTYKDFATYLATRSSRIRKTAANRTRKFDRDESSSFEIITSTDGLEAGLNLFTTLYEKRWKKAEPFPDFLPGLARMCADNGWLRLGIATIAGRPAAVQFWIVKDRIAYIYKVAYDEEFTKLSVGAVALFKMFEFVLDNEDVDEIDFLTGDDAYKKDWMSDVREMTGITAFNKRTLPGLAAAGWNFGRSALKSKFGPLVHELSRVRKAS